MEVQLRLFATFREAVGQGTVYREFEGETVSVGTVLRELQSEHPEMLLFEDDGTLYDHVSVMKNGREIRQLDGFDTALEDDDTLGVFPPVSGG